MGARQVKNLQQHIYMQDSALLPPRLLAEEVLMPYCLAVHLLPSQPVVQHKLSRYHYHMCAAWLLLQNRGRRDSTEPAHLRGNTAHPAMAPRTRNLLCAKFPVSSR
jgi:hypothetical protein